MPSGYTGLFWGTVYTAKGKKLESAEDYFMRLAEKNDLDEFDYSDLISEKIREYCNEHVESLAGDNRSYGCQCGFGGDESDGLIDFWLPTKVPDLPDMNFVILEKEYTLKWKYSG
jgi:hypothetical protein